MLCKKRQDPSLITTQLNQNSIKCTIKGILLNCKMLLPDLRNLASSCMPNIRTRFVIEKTEAHASLPSVLIF